MNSIAEWIKQIRKENNLNQKQLGKILNISQNTISQYETESREMDIDYIKLLAKKFKYNVNIGENGFTFEKIQEEKITMCDWCLAVIEGDTSNLEECPYCKNTGHLKRGVLKLPQNSRLVKRTREVVLWESPTNKYSPYAVSLLSASNIDNNGCFSLCYSHYFSTLDSSVAKFNEKLKEYDYLYNK